ncbi:hypothetical protein SUNI508_11311 [Seiridium unicorne]|uniref:Uncharacterized protein n=1 Tax=Seiridium unicorne TaxID=138068 RepID=A0ABR2UI88_9PEZI
MSLKTFRSTLSSLPFCPGIIPHGEWKDVVMINPPRSPSAFRALHRAPPCSISANPQIEEWWYIESTGAWPLTQFTDEAPGDRISSGVPGGNHRSVIIEARDSLAIWDNIELRRTRGMLVSHKPIMESGSQVSR